MKSKTVLGLMALIAISLAAAGCQQQTRGGSKGVKGLSRIYFDFDKSDVKSDSKKTLEDNASYLKKNKDTKVTVEGHCDERGTEEYNLALGNRRAVSTKNYLVSLGVDKKRLSTKSYGEEKALETCHNESCWWKNRRAEFVK